MRQGPDLSSFGSALPPLEELLPEEIRYLCDVCRLLAKAGICKGARSYLPPGMDGDYEAFDPDELGFDPELDAERWER